ncbi:hypothetical protein [Streptomyces sp. LS1784]|nr:hypothetical protein [Streptomyces sp. LS1784]
MLRGAGLVTRIRVDRAVRYEHTPLGAALADSRLRRRPGGLLPV